MTTEQVGRAAGPPRLPRRLAVDRRPGYYYVSIHDGRRLGLLLGPFRRHRQARRWVRQARERANEASAWAWFCAFGTVRLADGAREGVLNADLGVVPCTRRRGRR